MVATFHVGFSVINVISAAALGAAVVFFFSAKPRVVVVPRDELVVDAHLGVVVGDHVVSATLQPGFPVGTLRLGSCGVAIAADGLLEVEYLHSAAGIGVSLFFVKPGFRDIVLSWRGLSPGGAADLQRKNK